MSVGSFLIVAAGTGINLIHTVQKGNDPFPVMLGGAALGVACSAIDDVSKGQVGKAIALTFFLGSFITNGTGFLDVLNDAVSSPRPPTVPGTVTTSPASPGSSGGSGLSNTAPGSGAGGSGSGSF